MHLQYGWSPELQDEFQPFADRGLSPGRVIVQQRGHYRLVTPAGEVLAELSGKFAREALAGGYPVTGDWVAVAIQAGDGHSVIHEVMPRRTAFRRKAAGHSGGVQMVAANVDLALLVSSLNADLNLRRVERYLAAALESGAEPVVVLTKADACDDVAGLKAEVEAISGGAPVHAVSAVSGEGLEALALLLQPGRTAVLLGSSGAGKSTLLNALAGSERMATGAIREDDARGRHTTTHRELVLLPSGALVLDTPGMRELGLWDAEAGVAATFEDLETLAAGCRFTDCGHTTEPGCAVRAAIAAGDFEESRLEAWGKLQREVAWLERKDDPRARAESRKVWIARTKAYRAGKQRGDFQ